MIKYGLYLSNKAKLSLLACATDCRWTLQCHSWHPTVTLPQCYVCNSTSWSHVSLSFWCQYMPNTRLNTYSSKTSKRCTAFQILYGSDVLTGLVEHPMERTANGLRHSCLMYIVIVSKSLLGIKEIGRNWRLNEEFVWHLDSNKWSGMKKFYTRLSVSPIILMPLIQFMFLCWWFKTDSNNSHL